MVNLAFCGRNIVNPSEGYFELGDEYAKQNSASRGSDLPCESIDIPKIKPTFGILFAAKTFLGEWYNFGTLLPLEKAEFLDATSFKGFTSDDTVFPQ